MKIKILLFGFLFSTASIACAQEYDSTYNESEDYEYDSIDYIEEYETEDITSSHTINDPALLPISKANDTVQYNKYNFDKAKWKEIVGETTFAEEKEEEKSPSVSPAWGGALLKIIAYGIIIAVIIAIFYFLVKAAFAEEVSFKKNGHAESLLYDEHIDDVSEQNIESLLKRALDEGDFRTAVRLYYIRLLKHLHSSNFILWKRDKTNRDYSYELSKTPFIKGFQKITLAYEIIWYGERSPTPTEFETLQKSFHELQDLTSTILNEKQ